MAKKKARNSSSTAEQARTCLDCRHLVAIIPVFHGCDGKLLYDAAPVSCRLGHLVYCKGGEKRTFKTILTRSHQAAVKNMAAWREAETCPDYDSMNDDENDPSN